MTIRLYFDDSFCRSFDAHIASSHPSDAGWEIALDRTCFYPTSGGQPNDLGTLNGIPVLDVREEGSGIWHVLPELPAGETVHGEIDWPRRFDHMQQHSGQHILSAVALEQLGAQTVSFHLGAEVVTIDLDRGKLAPEAARALEDESNRLVMADLPVRATLVAPADLPRLNLRKQPTKGEQPRIVEISGVDLSPCGGTHVASTGQIGMIKIRRLEHYKGGTRVEFLCGWRALRDYQWKHEAVSSLARDLSIADRELEAAVRRLVAGEKDTRRQIEELRRQLLAYEASALRARAQQAGGHSLIVQVFPDRAALEVKQLAGLLTAEAGTIALLATLSPAVRLVFMRAQDVDLDMHGLLRVVTQRFGGGGGGRPETAEGGGMSPDQVNEALAWAAQQLVSTTLGGALC